jgi:hypothetical protein
VEAVRQQLSFGAGQFAGCDKVLFAINGNSTAVSLFFKHLDGHK